MASQAAIAKRRALVMQCLTEIPSANLDEIKVFLGQRGIEVGHGTVVRDRQAVLAEGARGDDARLGYFDESVYILMDLARKAHRDRKPQSAAGCIRELKSLLKLDDVVTSNVVEDMVEKLSRVDEMLNELIDRKREEE